jgi:formate/nitrite transporter FocA (FNT family)
VSDYLFAFLAPTLIGNTIGGVALVALLNHAPLAPEFQDGAASEARRNGN